ncbi:MAG: preprotein translocase subunit SecE [Clostridiales bacterium]|nr:preprotein translocase subunit SecE [Clostridiales bacterium]
MADNKGNIFQRIAKGFTDVIAELKRVTWPTKDKLAKTSAVVLLVIAFFAVYLTIIGSGGRWVLDKIGFYNIVETTAASTEASETTAAAETTAASETAASETTAATTESSAG